MSNSVYTVSIDRIILTGLKVTPERAQHIRAMVEVELQRLLERDGLLNGLAAGEVSHLDAPAMHVTEPHSDSRLASGLAQSVAQTLSGMEGG